MPMMMMMMMMMMATLLAMVVLETELLNDLALTLALALSSC